MSGIGVGFGRRAVVVGVLSAVVAACGGTGGPGATSAGGGGGTGGGGTGSIGQIDACSLLSQAEIQSAAGKPVKAGVKEDLSGAAAGCDWDAQVATDAISISLKITEFDQDLWNSEKGGTGIEAMPGIGDEAFRGFVTKDLVLIHKGNMEIDLGVISILDTDDHIKAALDSLGKLVVSRV